jgi:YfiH family protein
VSSPSPASSAELLLRARVLDAAGFAHAFPARHAQEVDLLASLGVESITQVRQVHGATAVEAAAAALAEADAIVARACGGAVGVRVADCVPVLVGSTITGDAAAIHAGWRGVAQGVIGSGVSLLGGLGGRGLVAAIGPCIGPCCFEVGLDVADRLGFVVRRVGDKAYVDLRAAVRAQLVDLGLLERDIEDVPGCTKHDPRFHSFRRDGGGSGRMLASIRPRFVRELS